MSRQSVSRYATFVALVIVVLACAWFSYSSFVQPAISATGSIAGGNNTSDAGQVPSPVTEQVDLNWSWFLLLLLIPLTGFAIYYYEFVRGK